MCREVTGARAGREGSTGLGQMVAALRGLAAEQGPEFGVVEEGDLFRLANTYQALRESGRGDVLYYLNLRPFIFVHLAAVVNKISIVPAFPESSTDIF